MSTAERFERDCAYCCQPIRLKWKKGLIPPEGACLVADQVFHDECWDKYWATFEGAGQGSKGNGGRGPGARASAAVGGAAAGRVSANAVGPLAAS